MMRILVLRNSFFFMTRIEMNLTYLKIGMGREGRDDHVSIRCFQVDHIYGHLIESEAERL